MKMEKILIVVAIFGAVGSSHASNHPSVLTAISTTVGATQNLSFVISATDLDGDSLTYSATGMPTGATFDPATRTFTGHPQRIKWGHLM